MSQSTSFSTRVAYCVTLLGAILPIGLAKSGWVSLAAGHGFAGGIPYLGPIALLIVGLYRIYVVARVPSTLNSEPVAGFIAFLRTAGIILLYVGAIAAVLGWIAGPLMHSLMRSRAEGGAAFFALGVIFALLGRVGVIGLILYELSRLRGFEKKFATGV